jgi:hydroxymethylglutaryl-CoA lyase
MAAAALGCGRQVQVSVQSAFGCGFEGRVPPRRVLDLVRAYLEAGLDRISLADTAGQAQPGQVKRLFGALQGLGPVVCTAHFHDRRGRAMANIQAAMAQGVESFETSFAGLGGCPFTKDAAGNVATEVLVRALQSAGRRLDIHLDRLEAVARSAADFFGRRG